jgi:hypothetical protein
MPVRRMLIAIAVSAAAGVLAGCGSDGGSSASRSSTSSSSSSSTSSPTTPPPAVQGRTDWRDVTPEWKALAPAPFDEGPEAVADDLAALARGRDTSSVGQIDIVAIDRGEPLLVVLRESGVDDVVAQTDIEITLEPSDEGWVVSKARAQDSCYRGVVESEPTRCR